MKNRIRIAIAILAIAGQAVAEPIKCVTAGKTIYTDDPALCRKGTVKPIAGSVIISSFPKELAAKKAGPTPNSGLSSMLGAIPGQNGISPQDFATGWQTILDAGKRGAWQAPEIPDQAK